MHIRLHHLVKSLVWYMMLYGLDVSRAVEVSFTIEVDAGVKDCFHHPLKKDLPYETEFQVLDGGDLDIDFSILTQSGYAVLTDIRKTGQVHRLTASETGDYSFCFDNTFSRFTTKLIYFEIVTEEADEVDEDELFGALPNTTLIDVSLETVKDALEKIHNNLQKSISMQKLFAAIELRDRSISENNFERVNFWSSVQVVAMVIATIANIILIRGLFSSRDKASHGAKVRT